jgi:hypothetical protein
LFAKRDKECELSKLLGGTGVLLLILVDTVDAVIAVDVNVGGIVVCGKNC